MLTCGFSLNEPVKKNNEKNGEVFKTKTKFKLIVDTHEPQKIFNILLRNKIDYTPETLPIGDFVYGDICIERKSITDFVQSIQKKHLQKQLIQMEENFARPFLIISGNLKDLHFMGHIKGWTVNHHLGALASCAIRYPKLKIIQVDNDTQLINTVVKIIDKSQDGKTPTIYDTELLKSKMTNEDIEVMMIGCIPKMGIDKAKKVAKVMDIVFHSKKTGDFINKEELLKIDGIGETIANRIIEINDDRQ